MTKLAIPSRLILALFFAIGTLFLLQLDKYHTTRQVLGWQTETQAKQQKIYDWEEILKAKPDYRDGWLQLAAFWAEEGDKTQALAALAHAKALDPLNPVVLSLEKLLTN